MCILITFQTIILSARLAFLGFYLYTAAFITWHVIPVVFIFLISDYARRSPDKHSRLFWEPRQFFKLVWRLRRYSLSTTYEHVHLILLGWIVLSVSRAFPLDFRPCSSFFKVHQLGCIIQVMVPSLVAHRLYSLARQLSPFLLFYLL